MKVTVEKKDKSTLDMTVVVPQDRVRNVYDTLLAQVAETAEIKGFRKGQAPKEMVEEKTDLSKLYGEVINNLLQLYYPQALKEQYYF
jgi:trigger factor